MNQPIKPHLSSAGKDDQQRRTYGLSVEEFLVNEYDRRVQAVANAFIGGLPVRAMTEAEATQRYHSPLVGEYGNAGGLSGRLSIAAQDE